MFEKNYPSGKDANSAEIFLKTIIYLSQVKFNIDDEIIGLKIIIILSMSSYIGFNKREFFFY
jgi:hypothetical protein